MSRNANNDPAIEALVASIAEQHKQHADAKFIWLADEHPISLTALNKITHIPLLFISNRLDQAELAESFGVPSRFCDFSINDQNHPDQIFIRVPKERALVHYLANQAFCHLRTGGKLWLFGFKNEGIKTHIANAAKLFGGKTITQKGKQQLSIACLIKGKQNQQPLPDDNYANLRSVTLQGQTYFSKPGIYGWNKIDRGSELLFDTLIKEGTATSGLRILDIGCGYGYLSHRALTLNPKILVATDNCSGALAAAQANLEDPRVSVQSSDAADRVEGQFDLVLCNPPFHQGFGTTPDLHRRFLDNTQRLLGPTGSAWYVVNQFLALEKPCAEAGLNAEEIVRADGFKVFRLTAK